MADKLTRQLFAILRKAGPLTRDQRLALYRWITWRDNIETTNDLSPHELQAIVTQLRSWDDYGVIDTMVAQAIA